MGTSPLGPDICREYRHPVVKWPQLSFNQYQWVKWSNLYVFVASKAGLQQKDVLEVLELTNMASQLILEKGNGMLSSQPHNRRTLLLSTPTLTAECIFVFVFVQFVFFFFSNGKRRVPDPSAIDPCPKGPEVDTRHGRRARAPATNHCDNQRNLQTRKAPWLFGARFQRNIHPIEILTSIVTQRFIILKSMIHKWNGKQNPCYRQNIHITVE